MAALSPKRTFIQDASWRVAMPRYNIISNCREVRSRYRRKQRGNKAKGAKPMLGGTAEWNI